MAEFAPLAAGWGKGEMFQDRVSLRRSSLTSVTRIQPTVVAVCRFRACPSTPINPNTRVSVGSALRATNAAIRTAPHLSRRPDAAVPACRWPATIIPLGCHRL